MKNVLLGQVCLDIYTRTGHMVPGCGILHNAFHLQQLGCRPLLLTRTGSDNSAPLRQFIERNHIAVLPDSVDAPGQCASIEVAVTDAGEAIISNPVNGVWQNFRLYPAEERLVMQTDHLHTVLVKNMHAEFLRLGAAGFLVGPLVSGDFLDLRDFTVDHLARFLPYVNLAFIGWKGALNDPRLAAIEKLAQAHPVTLVITLGSRGILVFHSSGSGNFERRFFAVEPVAVQQNTNGCGDAFISYFLADYWQYKQLDRAVAHGKLGGQLATTWQFALPNQAYAF
jgi:sugar/nucleoside kinase (ribokinase family)